MDYADVVKLRSFRRKRDSAGAVSIDKLEMKGADFYADVSGEIEWLADILNSAARMRLNLGSKGQVSELAKQIGLTEGRLRGITSCGGRYPSRYQVLWERLDYSAMRTVEKIGSATRLEPEASDPAKRATEESPADQLKVRPLYWRFSDAISSGQQIFSG